MKNLAAVILISLIPALGHAALLKYEFEFSPSVAWPGELPAPDGNGYLIADTQLNAVVSGELASDFFHFTWTDATPPPITFISTYIDWHVVSGGNFQGIDLMSGIAGDLSLFFYLPPDLDNYSESLDQHPNTEDVYWDLTFPDYGPPADQWSYQDLELDVTVFAPTLIKDTPVPEPATYTLLSLGLMALGGARLRRCASKGRVRRL